MVGASCHHPVGWPDRCAMLTQAIQDGPYLRVGPNVHMCGEVLSMQDEMVKLRLIPFKVCLGFDLSETAGEFNLWIPNLRTRSIRLAQGCVIMCISEASIKGNDIFCSMEAKLLYRPEIASDLPWHVSHLFSGSFCGWSQAVQWLSDSTVDFRVNKELFVDHSNAVMSAWQKNHQAPMLVGPIKAEQEWIAADKIGVLSNVRDQSILHLVTAQGNHLATASPPCVSWSKGGKGRGLECEDGAAFLDAILLAFDMQVNVLVLECADEFLKHDHAKIVEKILRDLGYCRTWEQIVTLHPLTHNNRSRWLAVWVRASEGSRAVGAHFGLTSKSLEPWTSERYRFDLPDPVRVQLYLSDTDQAIYGSRDLLLPAKKHKLPPDATIEHVLHARVPLPGDPLPTLCASYSSQHELDPSHLAQKGIFAALMYDEGKFRFIEPTRFMCLLGATKQVTLPIDLQQAFLQIGNAIAVPHAIVAIAVALTSSTAIDLSPPKLAQQAWQARMHAEAAVVVVDGDYWSMMSNHSYAATFSPKQALDSEPGFMTMEIRYGINQSLSTSFPREATWHSFNNAVLGIPAHIWKTIQLSADSRVVKKTETLMKSFHDGQIIQVARYDCGVCSVCCNSHPTDLIPPTLPFEIVESQHTLEHLIANLDEDAYFGSADFWRIARFLDLCSFDPCNPRNSLVTIVLGEVGEAIAIALPCQAHRAQLGALLKTFFRNEDWFITEIANSQFVQEQHPTFVVQTPKQCQQCLLLYECIGRPNEVKPVFVKPQTQTKTTIESPSQQWRVSFHNGLPVQHLTHFRVKHADVVTWNGIPKDQLVKAGGHPQAQQRYEIQAGSNFLTRCEFAENTDGFCAADELFFLAQLLERLAPEFARFPGVLYWNTNDHDFTSPGLGEIAVYNNRQTIIPILADAHWCAAEISRVHASTKITIYRRL